MDDDYLKKESAIYFPNLYHNDSPNLDPDYSPTLRIFTNFIFTGFRGVLLLCSKSASKNKYKLLKIEVLLSQSNTKYIK